MRQKSVTLKDLLETCLGKLDDGTYQAPGKEKIHFLFIYVKCAYYCSIKCYSICRHNDFFFSLRYKDY